MKKSRLKAIKALADRGVGGERENAKRMYNMERKVTIHYKRRNVESIHRNSTIQDLLSFGESKDVSLERIRSALQPQELHCYSVEQDQYVLHSKYERIFNSRTENTKQYFEVGRYRTQYYLEFDGDTPISCHKLNGEDLDYERLADTMDQEIETKKYFVYCPSAIPKPKYVNDEYCCQIL